MPRITERAREGDLFAINARVKLSDLSSPRLLRPSNGSIMRLRKCLGYQSPHEAFPAAIRGAPQT